MKANVAQNSAIPIVVVHDPVLHTTIYDPMPDLTFYRNYIAKTTGIPADMLRLTQEEFPDYVGGGSCIFWSCDPVALRKLEVAERVRTGSSSCGVFDLSTGKMY